MKAKDPPSLKAWRRFSRLLERPGVIQGKLIRLWSVERHDLLKNYQWANDRELIRLAGMNPLPKSVWEVERWYETSTTSPSTQIFAIKSLDGEYLGNIELADMEVRVGRAEVGVLVGERSFWGKGIGSDAVYTLCKFAFEELRMHRLEARVLEHNERARRIFEKVGFKSEGIERESHYAEGKWWNVTLLGLLERELDEP
jgi:RimJ/RimL family protein N-acetyltransferase